MSTVNSVTVGDLVALDIETTGLTPEGNIILEIGVYTPKIGVPWRVAIAPEGGVLPKMDGVVVAMHTKSGLLAECLGDLAIPLDSAENRVINLLREYGFKERQAIMVGKSIHFDRAFIKARMPRLDAFFHYRMIDTSALAMAFAVAGRAAEVEIPPQAHGAHRAGPDAQHAWECLRAHLLTLNAGLAL